MKNYLLSLCIFLVACEPSNDEKDQVKEVFYEEQTVTESVFTTGIEGPAFYDGMLYAVNYEKEGTVGVINSVGEVETHVVLPEGSIGNGIRFNKSGDMFIADYPKHNILKLDAGSNEVEVFAHEPNMNQPNDIAIMQDGTLIASDPSWSDNTGKLWTISNTGDVTLVEEKMGTTNGVEVSPDDKFVYVNESVQRKVWKYEVDSDNSLKNKTLFYEFKDFGMDGMRCDVEGNLYIARYGKGVVAIVSPEGELIREVKLPGENPTNVAFGGPDFKTVFVTLQSEKKIVSFKSEFKGRVSLF